MRKGNFLQQDVTRAIKAAHAGGLALARVVIDASLNRITLYARDGSGNDVIEKVAIERRADGNRTHSDNGGVD